MNVCPECGFSIGSFVLFMDAYSQNMKKTNKNIKADKATMPGAVDFNYQEIFDILNIKSYCCRMHITCKWDPPFNT